MEIRPLGATGLRVSVLGFGCGAVGGLMVRGDPADQERAVARAVELGITYFDTAAGYGDGVSETNLGRALRVLRADVVVGTKFHATAGEASAIAVALETSLRRLGRERVDLFQLHNTVSPTGRPGTIRPETVIDEVIPELLRLRAQGKIGHAGFTAVGDTGALHRVLAVEGLGTAQIPFNLLNPSALGGALRGPGQDYAGTLAAADAAGLGVIAIRTLAGGALSGSLARHPMGAQHVDPIGSGPDYASDAARALDLRSIAQEAGVSLIELAIRFVISHRAVGTAMVGLSDLAELEFAAGAALHGPLPDKILQLLRKLTI